jgi:glycosyltransferase involved in cell wall biosynthesis
MDGCLGPALSASHRMRRGGSRDDHRPRSGPRSVYNTVPMSVWYETDLRVRRAMANGADRALCWIAHRDPAHPRAGGAEKSMLETARGLTARGWSVSVVSGGFAGALEEERVGPLLIRRGSGPLGMHLELPQLLARSRPFDVVVEDLGHVVPFLAERMVSTPGVVFFRHLHHRTLPGQVGPLPGALLTLTERAYPTLYRRWPLIVPSRSAMVDLLALGFEDSRIHLIPYGVDAEVFRPAPLSAEPSLIYFSGLRRYKRPEHALRVLALLRERGLAVTLTMVGQGPQLDALRRTAADLGIAPFVEFTGRLTEPQLATRVARSWVHVQCSVAEGWGLTAWEAAACGVPTVAYDVAGLTDSVVPGVSGTLVASGHVTALAEAAADILRSRDPWTQRARELVQAQSWDAVASQWDGLLRGLARSS